MKKNLILGLLSALLLLATGCTSLDLGGGSSSKSPMSQERIAASVDINEEIFGIGSAAIEESGRGVAKMRASKDARDDIKKKLLNETETVLKAYLVEIDFYSKKISDKVMSDLSEYITNNMLNDTVEKDSWVENDRVYTVIAIDRAEVPLRSRDTFVSHIDTIIAKLSELKGEIMEIPVEKVTPVVPAEKNEDTSSVEPSSEAAETQAIEEVQEVDLSDSGDEVIDVQL